MIQLCGTDRGLNNVRVVFSFESKRGSLSAVKKKKGWKFESSSVKAGEKCELH